MSEKFVWVVQMGFLCVCCGLVGITYRLRQIADELQKMNQRKEGR